MRQRRISGAPALRILGRVFPALGLLAWLGAGEAVWVESRSGRDAAATGVVLDTARQPLIRFTTATGDRITFRAGIRSTSWSVGDALPIAYDPAHPEAARVAGFRWLLPAVFGVIGGVFLLVGGVLWGLGRRRLA